MPVFLTTTGAGTYTVPAGVTSLTVEAIGGGGAGLPGATNVGTGGEGGHYAKATFSVTPAQVINYSVGTGGTSSGAGNPSWFGGSSLVTSNVGALGGAPGSNAVTNATTATTNDVGTVKRQGGFGAGFGANFVGGTGGGGAAGPGGAGGGGGTIIANANSGAGGGGAGNTNGAGGAGANTPSVSVGGAGGTAGDGTAGGAGGNGAAGSVGSHGSGGGGGGLASLGGAGGPGNESTWDATHGPGGGGGGSGGTGGVPPAGGAGGLYGGGGGGGAWTGSVGGAGAQGIIVVTEIAGSAPFASDDWPIPGRSGPSVELKTWVGSLKVNLRGQDTFFGPPGQGPDYDWPNPRGPVPATDLKTWLNPLDVQLLSKDRFFGLAGSPQFDWPNPVRARLSAPQSWLSSMPLNVFSSPLMIDWTTSAGPLGADVFQDLPSVVVQANTVIIVACRISGGINVTSITNTGTGLTWARRARTGIAQTELVEEWWAGAVSPNAGMVITVNFSGTPSAGHATAFGVLGSDPRQPFDTNLVLPHFASFDASGGIGDPITVTTTAANTLCFGLFSLGAVFSPTAGAGFTPIYASDNFLTEYALKFTQQTNLPVSITTGVGNADASIGDAIVASGALGAPIGQDQQFPNPPLAARPPISLLTWAEALKTNLQGKDQFYGLAGAPQFNWPNPTRTALTVPPTWLDPLKLTLSFVIAPFGQADWPVPSGPRYSIDLRTFLNSLEIQLQSQDQFFGLAGNPQRDWPNPRGASPLLQSWIDPYKFTLNGIVAPFVQGDWPNPRGPLYAITLRTWVDPFKGAGTDTFFGLGGSPQTDWPVPPKAAARVISLWTWTDPLRLQLQSRDSFFGLAGSPQFDWPVPKGFTPGISLRTWTDPLKLELAGKDTFFGLAGSPQYDWPVPKAPVRTISLWTWVEPLKLLQGQDAFFGLGGSPQFNWPNPRGTAPLLQTWTDSYKLALNGVPVPFVWQDWPNPRGRAPLLQDWTASLRLNLAGRDTFFGLAGSPQHDWPNPRRAAPLLQAWVDPYRYALNAIPAPFVQGSWPNPAGPVYAIALRTWVDPFKGQGKDTFFGLAGNPQRNWPNPAGPVYGISLRTWTASAFRGTAILRADPFLVNWG